MRGRQPKTQEWGVLTVMEYEVESHQWLKTASKAPMSAMKKSRRIFICMIKTWVMSDHKLFLAPQTLNPSLDFEWACQCDCRENSTKRWKETGQMLHLFQSNQIKPQNGSGNNLAGLPHKVSEHHLHHEWAVTGCHYSHWIHQLSTVGIGPKNKKYMLKILNKTLSNFEFQSHVWMHQERLNHHVGNHQDQAQ
jgi:hypothetical protein